MTMQMKRLMTGQACSRALRLVDANVLQDFLKEMDEQVIPDIVKVVEELALASCGKQAMAAKVLKPISTAFSGVRRSF